MLILKYALIAGAGYLLGSFNASILLSRLALGRDVRKEGSGNAGATNMTRLYGWKAGALALCADMLKAALALLLGSFLLGDFGIAVSGIACMLGHCFPVFYHFKGGKGISVGAMIGLAIDWRVFLAIVAAFLLAALLSKKVSVGSLAAALMISLSSILFHVSTPKLVLALVSMCIAVFQHRQNMKRLADGKEPDFKAGREQI